MKIEYILLKNYIGIYNGLGLKEIRIDFSKYNNKFILIVGENGSGKTTLLSAMHPFSGVSESERSKIIRPKKKGYKEIHISDNDIRYIIKHYYEPTTTSHSIKSFITKVDANGNEVELNENGNVTTFLEAVYLELGVSSDYINLIRLGSNMKGLIGMTATKRKEYISQFISEAEIYLKYYKKVNNDCRIVNGLIKNVSDKLDKFGDMSDISQRLDKLNSKVNELNLTRDNILGDINRANTVLMMLDPNGEIQKKYSSIINTISSNEKVIRDANNKISSYGVNENITYNEISVQLISISDKLSKSESKHDKYKSNLEVVRMNKTEYFNKIEECKDILSKYQDSDNLDDLKELRSLLVALADENKEKIVGHEMSSSKSELLYMYSILDHVNKMIETIHVNYPIDVVNVLEIMNEDELRTEYIELSNSIQYMTNDVMNTSLEISRYKGSNEVLDILKQRPSSCNIDSCPFIKNALSKVGDIEILSNLEDKYEKSSKKLEKMNSKLELLSDKLAVIDVYKSIIKTLQPLSTVKYFINNYNEKKILKHVIKNKMMYQPDEMTYEIQMAELYEEYNEITKIKIPQLNLQIDSMELNQSLVNKMRRDLDEYKHKYNTCILDEEDILNKLNELDEDISKYSTGIKIYRELMDVVGQKENNLKELEDNRYELRKYEKAIVDIKKCKQDLDKFKYELRIIESEITEQSSQRDKQMFKYKQSKKLIKEKKILETNFKEMDMLKRALSSKEGLPTVFVKHYMSQTRGIANELLSEAFEGRLTIDEFEINEKEFSIPCSGKGERNADISSASEGERALMGLAISFALARQSSVKYNIMLLDELDGPLDKKHRRLYVNILDKQSEVLDIEQIVTISHNDAYSSNDVGLILLRNHNMSNTKNYDIIYEY